VTIGTPSWSSSPSGPIDVQANLPSTFTERYDLLECIGRGGMGECWSARDSRLDRLVAVKFIQGACDEAVHRRFLREAAPQVRLSHPGIVEVTDFDKDGAAPYIAFELVDGETLWARVQRRGAFMPAAAVACARSIAEAMAYAHEHGVLHRDLKSENVMILPDGSVKIIDFGLARRADVTSTLTKTGVILGTPAYMAPEVLRGQAATAASDVYGAGIVLFELLTGVPPFEGDTAAAIVTKRLTKPTPTPRVRRPELDGALEAIVLRPTAADPGARTGSFVEFIEQLTSWQVEGAAAAATIAVVAVEPDAPSQPKTSPAPRRFGWLLTFLLAAATVAAAVRWRADGAPTWGPTLRLVVTAQGVQAAWRTPNPVHTECAVLVRATRARVGQASSDGTDHEIVIDGLGPATAYVLVVDAAGTTVERTFVTSAASLERGVFVGRLAGGLFVDFASPVTSGLQFRVDDGDGEVVATHSGEETPFVLSLPPPPVVAATRALRCRDSVLAARAVPLAPWTAAPPYRRDVRRRAGRAAPTSLYGEAPVWVGDHLVVADVDGVVACWRLPRQQGVGRPSSDGLPLAWLYRHPATEPHGTEFAHGGLTALPDGRVVVAKRTTTTTAVVSVLDVPGRADAWQVGFEADSNADVVTWLDSRAHEWHAPLGGREAKIRYRVAEFGQPHRANGVAVCDTVYFATERGSAWHCVAFGVDDHRLLSFDGIDVRRLDAASRRKVPSGVRFIWEPRGPLFRCGGRICMFARSRQRWDGSDSGPFEWLLLGWSMATGAGDVDLQFRSWSNVLDPVVDEATGTILVLASHRLHRLRVVEGTVTDRRSDPLFTNPRSADGGDVTGPVCMTDDKVLFIRRDFATSFGVSSSFAPGLLEGRLTLYRLMAGGDQPRALHPPLGAEADSANRGSVMGMRMVGPLLVAYGGRFVATARPVGDDRVAAGFWRAAIPNGETLYGWAPRADGLLAMATIQGTMLVVPAPLVALCRD